MIGEKRPIVQYGNGLSGSWMTESQITPKMFRSSEFEKTMSHQTAQLSRSYFVGDSVNARMTRTNLNREQHQQSCTFYGSPFVRPQEVPNLEDKNGATNHSSVPTELSLSDTYPYERSSIDAWTQDENSSILDIEDCLNPDWESSLIRKSIDSTELEIYLPRDLSPTPIDNLYSTLPQNSKDVQNKQDEYKDFGYIEGSNNNCLSVSKESQIKQFSDQIHRRDQSLPRDNVYFSSQKQTCAQIGCTEDYVTHDVRQNTVMQNRQEPQLLQNIQYERPQQIDQKPFKEKQMTTLQPNCTFPVDSALQRTPIMSSKVIRNDTTLTETESRNRFASLENIQFPPIAKYRDLSNFQFSATHHDNKNLLSPNEKYFRDNSFYGHSRERRHHEVVSNNLYESSSPTSSRPHEKLRYMSATNSCTDFAEDHHQIESEHNNYVGGSYDNVATRLTHNDIERQRRNQMKIKFDNLKACLPDISKCERSPKILVLNRAKDYICWLQEEGRVLETEKEKLKRLNRLLLQKLVHLTGSVKGK